MVMIIIKDLTLITIILALFLSGCFFLFALFVKLMLGIKTSYKARKEKGK